MPTMTRSRRLPSQIGRNFVAGNPLALAGSVLGVASVTALIVWLRQYVEIHNDSILYVLPVVVVASSFGRGYALLVIVLAYLSHAFFLSVPIYSFRVASVPEWLGLIVLLITAAIVGGLAAQLRERAHQAETREHELALLYELSRVLGTEDSLDRRLALAARLLSEHFGVSGCRILLAQPGGALTPVVAHSSETGAADGPTAASVDAVVGQAPMLVGKRLIGAVQMTGRGRVPSLDERDQRHFAAAADLLAQAIERERLATEATDAEVLRRADQAKSALLSSVSHDLDTPLASITAATTSLLNEQVNWHPSARRELLLTIEAELTRLTRYVARLLDLSRIESGAATPLRDWHAIEEILTRVADELDPPRARVRLALADDLPMVEVDYVMAERIVSNLVENALKYSTPDTPVEVVAEARNGCIVVDVADRGAGVPWSERDHIFERFYRSPGRPPGTAGTGMGLAIARGFALAHGGSLTYAPRPGGGSIFTATLPAATATALETTS
jgi:two-component system, OmpR family, sensor histidine kinase KdpD